MQQIANSIDAQALRAPFKDEFDAIQFYEQIVSLVPGILYIYNHKHETNEYSNNSIGALLGYSPEEVLEMGENVLPNLIHPDDLPRLGRYFASLKSLDDGVTTGIEYRAIASDGSTVWLRSNDAIFQRDTDGEVLRHIGVSNDVTEQVTKSLRLAEINKELEERTAQLERSNAELEQLAYIATHDLKVPLSNLSHLVEMLEEELETPSQEATEALGWMQGACRQANEKLAALVRVAEVRSGELNPRAVIDLASATQKACHALSCEIAEAGARIEIDFSAAPAVLFPEFEISSMFENLISNALRYAHPARRPVITLQSRKCAHGVEMCIRDNGRGLSLPQDAEKVFGLFKRAHVHPEGSGIALYIIRKMLERYGGSITVDSSKGEWTEFALTFTAPERAGS